MFSVAEAAAEELGEDFDCALIDPRFTKPIDEDQYAKTADLVVTLEDHVLPGGYGSLVAELMVENGVQKLPIRIGWPDQFVEHANRGEIEKYGLTAKAVVEQVRGTLTSSRW